MPVPLPRIVIAGVQSGVGKTVLTLSIVARLTRRGLKVQTFKVGPDFLDPTHLAIASGRPCYNLDGWMCGRDHVERLFARVTRDADLAVIEGVMGLFDGAEPSGLEGSSAEIAAWLAAPVLLVVNTHGMVGSLAALVAGYAGFEEAVSVDGVIANFCGSERHQALLAESLKSAGLPPLVGAIPRGGLPELRSRHLGLVSADPSENLTPAILDALAEAAERFLSLDEILRLARQAPSLALPLPEWDSAPERIRLGVAYDQAFHFYYQDLFDELRRWGCVIVPFSPLRDACLPGGIDGLYLGGGYPEEFAEALSANESMLESIRRFARSGRPLYAECGGLIYLSRAVTTREGRRYPLLGLLPAETRMLDRRKFLGYAEITLKEDSLWGKAGDRLRGHEFHYSELLSDPAGQGGWFPVYRFQGHRHGAQREEGFQQGGLLASYVHLHLASRPQALGRFVEICARSGARR
jgi:cobyrinic acid a,c-diamide synthase